MKLTEYLLQTQRSISDIARDIDYCPKTISHYIHGRKKPGDKVMRYIHKATNGYVTKDDWV